MLIVFLPQYINHMSWIKNKFCTNSGAEFFLLYLLIPLNNSWRNFVFTIVDNQPLQISQYSQKYFTKLGTSKYYRLQINVDNRLLMGALDRSKQQIRFFKNFNKNNTYEIHSNLNYFIFRNLEDWDETFNPL